MLIFERKIFRGIYGRKYENGEWKSRTNRELEEMSKGENIVKWIKGQMIRWLGHLERMEEDRMPKKMFTQKLSRNEKKGKTQENMERGSRKRSSSAWSEKTTSACIFICSMFSEQVQMLSLPTTNMTCKCRPTVGLVLHKTPNLLWLGVHRKH